MRNCTANLMQTRNCTEPISVPRHLSWKIADGSQNQRASNPDSSQGRSHLLENRAVWAFPIQSHGRSMLRKSKNCTEPTSAASCVLENYADGSQNQKVSHPDYWQGHLQSVSAWTSTCVRFSCPISRSNHADKKEGELIRGSKTLSGRPGKISLGSSQYNVSLESLLCFVATDERPTVSDRNQPECAVALSCAERWPDFFLRPQNCWSSCTTRYYLNLCLC